MFCVYNLLEYMRKSVLEREEEQLIQQVAYRSTKLEKDNHDEPLRKFF